MRSTRQVRLIHIKGLEASPLTDHKVQRRFCFLASKNLSRLFGVTPPPDLKSPVAFLFVNPLHEEVSDDFKSD